MDEQNGKTPFDPFRRDGGEEDRNASDGGGANQNSGYGSFGRDNGNPSGGQGGGAQDPWNSGWTNAGGGNSQGSGYGSFGRNGGTNGSNPGGDNGQGGAWNGAGQNGNFYGPDYFSGAGNSYGGQQSNGWGYNRPTPPPQKKEGHTALSVVSLICGILSIVLCCGQGYLQLVLAVAAIACGVVQAVLDKKMSGQSIAGVVTAAVGIVIAIFCVYAYHSGAWQAFLDEFQRAFEEQQGNMGGSGNGSSNGGSNGGNTIGPDNGNMIARLFSFSGNGLLK